MVFFLVPGIHTYYVFSFFYHIHKPLVFNLPPPLQLPVPARPPVRLGVHEGHILWCNRILKGGWWFPLSSLKVPQSSLGILRVPQLPPPLDIPPWRTLQTWKKTGIHTSNSSVNKKPRTKPNSNLKVWIMIFWNDDCDYLPSILRVCILVPWEMNYQAHVDQQITIYRWIRFQHKEFRVILEKFNHMIHHVPNTRPVEVEKTFQHR